MEYPVVSKDQIIHSGQLALVLQPSPRISPQMASFFSSFAPPSLDLQIALDSEGARELHSTTVNKLVTSYPVYYDGESLKGAVSFLWSRPPCD